MIYVCQNAQKLFQKAEIATKNLMLEILLSNLKLKNKNLTFVLNFPCWGAGEIQLAVSKSKIATSGEGFEGRFLTLASELCEDAKWQDLVNKLESANSSSLDQLGLANGRD